MSRQRCGRYCIHFAKASFASSRSCSAPWPLTSLISRTCSLQGSLASCPTHPTMQHCFLPSACSMPCCQPPTHLIQCAMLPPSHQTHLVCHAVNLPPNPVTPQKSLASEERKNGQGSRAGSKKAPGKASQVVSSTALTPGTPFMHDVCVALSFYVCARLSQNKYKDVSEASKSSSSSSGSLSTSSISSAVGCWALLFVG